MDIAYVWPPALAAGEETVVSVCVLLRQQGNLALCVKDETSEQLRVRLDGIEPGYQVLRIKLNAREAGSWLILHLENPHVSLQDPPNHSRFLRCALSFLHGF